MSNKPKEHENITEQMYRETSEHYMQELKKKDRIIKFLKNRLEEIDYHKNKLKEIKDQIKLCTSLQIQFNKVTEEKIYSILHDQSERLNCIDDSTANVDSDLQDYIDNYIEIIDIDTDSDSLEEMALRGN
jgi:esterase/lipase